jgi:P27 family predicted phage terminase small subunit
MPGTPGRSGGTNRRSDARKRLLRSHRAGRASTDTAPRARPERPAWLTDPVAVAAWDRVCDLLEDRGTLSLGDADAVLLAAVAEAEYRAADALIAAEGLVVDGKAHPATKIRESAWKRWSAALSRLGLDPVTRGRVEPAPPPREENPFYNF